jgi:hypothetical protein
VDLPDSLPAQLYLLTYNPEKERMDGRHRSGYLGPALRAAALLELLHRGRIADEGGKIVPAPGRGAVRAEAPAGGVLLDDPILARVLGQLEGSARHHSWAHWIAKDNSGITRCTRDFLESGRWLRVDRDRVVGIFPRTSVTVRDTRLVKALRADVHRAVHGHTPVDRLDQRHRELAALAAVGEIRSLLSWREARAGRGRIADLAAALGPAAPALRKVIRAQKAADAASAGG